MPICRIYSVLDLLDKDGKKISASDLLLEVLELARSGVDWSEEYSLKLHDLEESLMKFSIPLKTIGKDRELRIYVHETDCENILLVTNRALLANQHLNRMLTSLLNEEDEGREYTLTKGNQ